jgi:ATP-dependent Clp protease adapter protein ClpS
MSENKMVTLYNDYVNTFDHVIKTLSEVVPDCYPAKARALAMRAHSHRKSAVWIGDSDTGATICAKLVHAGLTAKLEEYDPTKPMDVMAHEYAHRDEVTGEPRAGDPRPVLVAIGIVVAIFALTLVMRFLG